MRNIIIFTTILVLSTIRANNLDLNGAINSNFGNFNEDLYAKIINNQAIRLRKIC